MAREARERVKQANRTHGSATRPSPWDGCFRTLLKPSCQLKQGYGSLHCQKKTGASVMNIVTSLSFRGQCREAFEFYAKVLGGKITAAHPYSEAPPEMPVSDPKYKDWLMH